MREKNEIKINHFVIKMENFTPFPPKTLVAGGDDKGGGENNAFSVTQHAI